MNRQRQLWRRVNSRGLRCGHRHRHSGFIYKTLHLSHRFPHHNCNALAVPCKGNCHGSCAWIFVSIRKNWSSSHLHSLCYHSGRCNRESATLISEARSHTLSYKQLRLSMQLRSYSILRNCPDFSQHSRLPAVSSRLTGRNFAVHGPSYLRRKCHFSRNLLGHPHHYHHQGIYCLDHLDSPWSPAFSWILQLTYQRTD